MEPCPKGRFTPRGGGAIRCVRGLKSSLVMDQKAEIGPRDVHLHLIYVDTCENPLFNGGGYLPSFVEYFYPISS
jgi:hypothetical protein